MRSFTWPVVLTLCVLVACPARARGQSDESEPNAAVTDTTVTDSAGGAGLERGMLTIRLHGGSLSSDPVASMPGLGGGGALNLSASVFPDASRVVGIDLEYLGTSRYYPNDFRLAFPIAGTGVSDQTDVSTSLIGAGVRLQLPPRSRLRAYGSVGYGYVHHVIKVDGTFIGLPVDYHEQTDSDWAPWVGAGAELFFGAWGVSVDYRRFSSSASFGEPFDVPTAELGGRAILVGVAWQPGATPPR